MTQLVQSLSFFNFLSEKFEEFKQKRKEKKDADATFRELSKLSNKELTDMGISRDQIWYIAYGDK